MSTMGMRPRILPIAREVRTRDDMHQFLEKEDLEVVSTKTTAAALSLMITQEFDAVVTDLQARKG